MIYELGYLSTFDRTESSTRGLHIGDDYMHGNQEKGLKWTRGNYVCDGKSRLMPEIADGSKYL